MRNEVLVVDDDLTCRDLLQEIVVEHTARPCRGLASGKEALELINSGEPFALAIVDALMPGMSGVELLRQAKKVDPGLDVMVVTGHPDKYSFVEVIQAGASDFLVKPFDVDEVEAKIKRVLRERALIEELRRHSARAAHEDVVRDYAEAATQAQFDRARAVLDSAPDSILIIDEDLSIVFANAACEPMFGVPADEAVGKKCYEMYGEQDVCSTCPSKGVFETRLPASATRMVRNRFGEVVFHEVRSVPLTLDYIDRTQVMEFVRDVTEIRELEAELRQLSIKDTVTNLSNRRHFLEVLEREMYRGTRQREPLSLLLTDIDGFKDYNDSRGHVAGDKVLVRVGAVIKECIRDGVDTGYRLGGDEFTAILPHTNIDQAATIAGRLLDRFREEDLESISLSIGVAEYDGEIDMTAFVDQADKAMYSAKHAGGDRIARG